MSFTKRKFLRLEPKLRHRKCAEWLRLCYERLLQGEDCEEAIAFYNSLLSWMSLNSYTSSDPKSLADRYHWHLSEAGRCLKEHHLLPSLRTGDRKAKSDFLPVAIYLDNIRSAYNVGSILRTTEALRLGSVYFSDKTPFADHEKILHTAMGAAQLVPCFRNVLLETLPHPIIALDTSNEAIPLSNYLFPSSFTLILGNEEYGISDLSLAQADVLLEIPLFGAKNSINVACAFAIAAAEIRRQTYVFS